MAVVGCRSEHPARLDGEREAGRLRGKSTAADYLSVGNRDEVCDRDAILDEPRGHQRRGLRQEG